MSASTPGQASGGRGERTVISPSILPGAIIASTDNSHSTVTEPAARKNNDAYMEEKTSKLLKLSDDELSKLNKKGKNKKEEAELEQLKSIKRKHKI